FAFRLGTNYCPTDQEVVEIRSLLVQPTVRIQSLDDKIASLQKTMDKLVEERDGLQSYVEAHRALISPVRRLPLDIIQEIFVACIPTHRNCIMSAIEAPILLGRICSAWRTISLTTVPRLWASLHVVEPRSILPGVPDYQHKVVQRLEITKTWLGRSGQCPLSISLQGAVDDDTDPSATTEFIQVLIPFASRWQHIHFSIPPSLIFGIMSNIDTDMPWVESVTFHCGIPHQAQNITCGNFGMLQSARLSSLSVPCGLFAIVQKLPLQWNQLTTLTIGGPDLSGFFCTSEMVLPVISKCFELRSCKLLLCDAETSAREHPVVELPFLHSLAIRCSSSVTAAVSILLKHLFLPKLRNFALLGFWGQESNCPALLDFCARSVILERFDITDNTFLTPSLDEILRSLPPTIQRLCIRSIPSHRPWGSQLTADDATLDVLASSGICPALRHLTIEEGTDITDAAILQFITTRMLKFEPPLLRHVEIRFHRDMTVDVMPSFQQFLENGLDISLDYPVPFALRSSPWAGLDDDPEADNSLTWVQRPTPVNYW
ncbi:hypothetical protein C8R45DRAFT_819275, partial [Mycena sanguinolenta]